MLRFFQKTKAILSAAIVLLIVGSALLCFDEARIFAQSTTPAPDNVFQSFSNKFGKGSDRASNSTIIVAVVVVVASVVLSFWLYDRYSRSRSTKGGYTSIRGLFRDLCKAHELSRPQQVLLRKIAKELNLDDPLPLFIEPRYLLRALSDHLVPDSSDAIRTIVETIFSEDVAPDMPSGTGQHDPGWFTWTSITENPDFGTENLATRKTSITPLSSPESTATSTTSSKQFDPTFWEDIERAGKGLARDSSRDSGGGETTAIHVPVFFAPPLRHDVLEADEVSYHLPQGEPSQSEPPTKTVYKPRYPETNDSRSGNLGGAVSEFREKGPAEEPFSRPDSYSNEISPPLENDPRSFSRDNFSTGGSGVATVGAQVLSSLISSVSDMRQELAAGSVHNLLNRSVSLSPQSFRELKPTESRGLASSFRSAALGKSAVAPREKPTAIGLEDLPDPKLHVRTIEATPLDLLPPQTSPADRKISEVQESQPIPETRKQQAASREKSVSEPAATSDVSFLERIIRDPRIEKSAGKKDAGQESDPASEIDLSNIDRRPPMI